MSLYATVRDDPLVFSYLMNDHQWRSTGERIGTTRYQHLFALAGLQPDLKLALKDPTPPIGERGWTQHVEFYGNRDKHGIRRGWFAWQLQLAYDVHRSLLEHEVVVESDLLCAACAAAKTSTLPGVVGCPACYERNVEATRVIGRVLEEKGWTPSYYYSGNKGVHVHVWLDFKLFLDIDRSVQERVLATYEYRSGFVKAFMKWLRELLGTCYGTTARAYDEQLANGKHLIRTALSRNKAGYKTFLGHTYKDVSIIPVLCNERTKIAPELGELRLSRPHCFQDLVLEFLFSKDKEHLRLVRARRHGSLMAWLEPALKKGELKRCTQYLLSDAFRTAGDGYQRALFYLAMELRSAYDRETALEMLREWNLRMSAPCLDADVRLQVDRREEYKVSHRVLHEFLCALGIREYGCDVDT